MIRPRQIAAAVNSNCNINTHATLKMMGGLNEEDVQTPRIMFVGLCDQHGISKEDIGNFLCIEPAQIELKLRQFYNNLTEGVMHKKRKASLEDYDPSDLDSYRFYLQHSLCQNYLLSRDKKGYINIGQISSKRVA